MTPERGHGERENETAGKNWFLFWGVYSRVKSNFTSKYQVSNIIINYLRIKPYPKENV